jgi:hypothetical protein
MSLNCHFFFFIFFYFKEVIIKTARTENQMSKGSMAISIEHKNLLKILAKKKGKRVVGVLCWGDTLGYYFNLKA